ncbi:MAG TPA: glycosyltransferase [Streptosporangiales bacterium]
MKLVAATYGTEGDSRPIAALCRALIDAGDEVTLLADGGTLNTARELGVPNAALAGDIREALRSGDGTASVPKQNSVDATAKILARLANENADAWMRQILEAAAGCDALIMGGLAANIGFSAAEKSGIPAIAVGMIPLTPTAAFPSPFLPPRPMPRFLNRVSYRLVSAALWRAFRDSTNSARRAVGLPPGHQIPADQPILYGISPTLLPQPKDWPAGAHMCGQWVRPVYEWDPPGALREFLSEGDAPIYVGFGSMAGLDHGALLDVVVEAVGGRRALLNPGWGVNERLELPPNFCVIGGTPHDWLFPRTSVVVHHGGSGTTHSATRAGVPSVVVPFAADQFFWARQLRRLGVAPRNAGARRVRASELSDAITAAQSARMRQRASELGAAMRAEDGLATAVEKIHATLASG